LSPALGLQPLRLGALGLGFGGGGVPFLLLALRLSGRLLPALGS
jgi:hypothetical protein